MYGLSAQIPRVIQLRSKGYCTSFFFFFQIFGVVVVVVFSI